MKSWLLCGFCNLQFGNTLAKFSRALALQSPAADMPLVDALHLGKGGPYYSVGSIELSPEKTVKAERWNFSRRNRISVNLYRCM